MSLWFGHQGLPLYYFLNSPNLDPSIGQEGNSLIKFIHLQGIICQPFSSKFIIVYISCKLVLHEIISIDKKLLLISSEIIAILIFNEIVFY